MHVAAKRAAFFMDFSRLLPRYSNAGHDSNRNASLLVLTTVGNPLAVTGFSLAGVGAMAVAMVDGSGNQITSFGGGTQYQNGSAQATPTGTVALGWDGTDVRALSTDSSGKLNITGSITASNPSVSATGAAIPTSATLLGGSDGVNLQALQVDASKNLKVVVQNGSIAVTGTFWQATQPVSIASLPSLAAGSNVIGGVTQSGAWNIGTVTTLSQFSSASALSDTLGNPTTTQVGSMLMGWNTTAWERLRTDIGDGSVSTGILNNMPMMYNGTSYDRQRGDTIAGIWVNLKPNTSGGLSLSGISSAASTNATSVKSSAGQVYGWAIFNNTSSNKYVKIYNKASAPTVGTDTPVMRVMVPPNGGTNVWFGNGIPLGTGIAFAITGGAADSDTTAVAANDVYLNLFYK